MRPIIPFFKKILLFNLIIFGFSFFLVLDVFADEASGFGFAAPSKGGGTGNCLSQWGGCTPGFGSNIAFRLTMVDLQGKKVEGTKSVDFSSSVFYKCTINGVKQNCPFSNYSLISGYYDKNGKYIARYDYKYSEKFNDYSIATDDNEFFMYYDSNDNFKTQQSVENFFKNDLLSTGWKYKEYDLTFYDMFLHYCGFLKDEEESYRTITDSKKKQQVYNSVIIFEPAYPVYYYSSATGGTVYRYGTVTELARTMLKNPGFGIDYGLSNALRKNVALCVSQSDKENDLVGFEAIEYGVDKKENCSNSDYYSPVSLQNLVDDTKAFGVSVGTISGPGITVNKCLKKECPPVDEDDLSLNYVINVCDRAKTSTNLSNPINSNDESNDSSTKIIFSSDKSVSPNELKKDYFKVSGSDENQSLYCYDSVEYYFDEMKRDISGNYNKFTFVNPRSAKAIVNRYCLMGNNYNLNEQYNIESYKDSAIRINFYGKTYDIYPSDSTINDQFNINNNVVKPTNFSDSNITFKNKTIKDVDVDGNNYKFLSYSFELTYIVPQNLLFVGNGNLDKKEGYIEGNTYKAYVSLANLSESFGYSNKIINTELIAGMKSAFNAVTCPVTFEIKNDSKTDISFRVISLDNPFPARDGSSRMPSENWLYDENNVYNYITMNRGKHTEEVYTTELGDLYKPMYTITLTPSTMINIRSYNKKYSYYSMYELGDYVSKDDINLADKNADKLRCNDQGRECYSEFLRDSKYIPQNEQTISGACFMSGGDSKNVRDEFNSFYDPSGVNQFFSKDTVAGYMEQVFKRDVEQFKYGVAYGADVNYNRRMDSEDIEIMEAYAKANSFQNSDDFYNSDLEYDAQIYNDKYIKYYTCAEKTYKSGGPVEGEE